MRYYLGVIFFVTYISIFPQEYSLLLGIGYEDECIIGENINAGFVQNLKTLCITNENDSLKIVADIPELIVKRDSGYWRAGIKRSVYNRCIEDLLWICPLETEPEIKGIDSYCGETCESFEEFKISYVNEKYIVVYNRGEGFCFSNAHPSFWHDYYWIPIDTLKNKYEWIGDLALNIPDDLPKIFSKEFYEGFINDGIKEYEKLDENTKSALEERPSKIYLDRQYGKWRTSGEYYWENEAARGMTADFKVTMLPPSTLVGNDNLSIPWDTIKGQIPNAFDAISSPDGRMLVVSTGNSLMFYKNINGSKIPSAPSLVYDLGELSFNILMINWFKDDVKTNSFLNDLSENFGKYRYDIVGPY